MSTISPGRKALSTREMMTGVVREGTGHNAAIAGYEVGGKTGTAQKMDPVTHRYSRAPGVLSFVGFVPAGAPRIAMLVMLDEPKNEKWGSEAAAPIFASIGREALRHLNVPPQDTTPVQIVRAEAGASDTPPLMDPPAGGRRLVRPVSVAEPPEPSPGMPSLTGLSLRQAMDALAPFGVGVEVVGRGIVTAQSPPAGAALGPGSVCRLILASPAAPSAAGR